MRCLPVLTEDSNEFIGAITLKASSSLKSKIYTQMMWLITWPVQDIADMANLSAIGGKDSYLRHVMHRRGEWYNHARRLDPPKQEDR